MEFCTPGKVWTEALTASFSKKLGMSKREMLQLLTKHGILAGLADMAAANRVDPTEVLELLCPILLRFSSEPPEGWLQSFYFQLRESLYPTAQQPADQPVLSTAGAFYLTALEWLLEQYGKSNSAGILAYPRLAEVEEISASRIREEYSLFEAALKKYHVLSLFCISSTVEAFDPAGHTFGVHNLAVRSARLARSAGLPVDVALVSAASLSHDIGKFGCVGPDAKRVPYLHYYYTWLWLSRQSLPHIAHVAANHSTWDLEFENLPIESLLLIYADFRVRGHWSGGKEHMGICSLHDSYHEILSKLSDMTPEKQRRYATVYTKLRDFEAFLQSKGVSPDPERTQLLPTAPVSPALRSGASVIDALRELTFSNSLQLMSLVSADTSFEQLLEHARGEKNLQRVRTYLLLFEEFNSYMSRPAKQMTLRFLYELLMHQDGDVRRRAGRIMGKILANSGPAYRKELPENAPKQSTAPAMSDFFAEPASLWAEYIELCLHPDRKITNKHALRISNSLKAIAGSLFDACPQSLWGSMSAPLLQQLASSNSPRDSFVLTDTLQNIPISAIPANFLSSLLPVLQRNLILCNPPLQLVTLQLLHTLLKCHCTLREQISAMAEKMDPAEDPALAYLRAVLLHACGKTAAVPPVNSAALYLSNLKNVVHWTVKQTQISILAAHARTHPETTFHTAMHLSNLLSVSEHLPVREYAGRVLLELESFLTVDQKNEIAVDLLRELETGQEQISYYIPPYVGRLLCRLPSKELSEGLEYLEDQIHSGTVRSACAALHTLGAMLTDSSAALPSDVICRVLGLLMVGVAHYDDVIHQTALTVLCRNVMSCNTLPLHTRRDFLMQFYKKLLCLLSEPRSGQLVLFNRAAMLNHLYRFIVNCEVSGETLVFPPEKPVAFFPGTFDPFSAGHRQIVKTILREGYEVYLAIDEFSWSKRTAPKLLRRKMAELASSDLWNVYLFPDDIPINLASPEDLSALRQHFPGRSVSLAAGSDVIIGASAYRQSAPGSAGDFDHVIFRRSGSSVELDALLRQRIRGRILLLSLPDGYDNVSSTRIREDVDKNMDISMLVDPLVQSFIYGNGLYLRSPQYKHLLQPGLAWLESARSHTQPLPPALTALLERAPDTAAVLLCSQKQENIQGWACGHTITPRSLLQTLGSAEAAAAVRQLASGRILMIDHVVSLQGKQSDLRRLVNELLARSLETDHTFALCQCNAHDTLYGILNEMGFLPVPGQPDLLAVDMCAPMVFIQDAMLWIKAPLQQDPAVIRAVEETRPKLRSAISALFPGHLVLTFDAELLNHALWRKVQAHNQVLQLAETDKQLGRFMCVPYGKILSDQVVPHTVTKALHADKVYDPDMLHFSIREYPGYSSLRNQIRTIKSFRRPVILVDDLLHRGHRIHNLDPLFKAEQVEVSRIIVGICSGQGLDLMQTQGRQVDCEYFIPNLHYWLTESLLYPFIGGDSVDCPDTEWNRPSVNLVLPYVNPTFIQGVSQIQRLNLSAAALQGARQILQALEQQHQKVTNTPLTLQRLPQALNRPRMPERGRFLQYDLSAPASSYLEDDLMQLHRISMTEVIHGL